MSHINRVDEFVSLYTQHSLRLRGFVRALVPMQPDADDVFQDVSRTPVSYTHLTLPTILRV